MPYSLWHLRPAYMMRQNKDLLQGTVSPAETHCAVLSSDGASAGSGTLAAGSSAGSEVLAVVLASKRSADRAKKLPLTSLRSSISCLTAADSGNQQGRACSATLDCDACGQGAVNAGCSRESLSMAAMRQARACSSIACALLQGNRTLKTPWLMMSLVLEHHVCAHMVSKHKTLACKMLASLQPGSCYRLS